MTSKTSSTAAAPASQVGAASPCPEPADDVDAWIDEGELPTKDVPLCINGRLQREVEHLQERAAAVSARIAAERKSGARRLSAGEELKAAQAELDALQAELVALHEKAKASTRIFRFRGASRPECDALMIANPPGNDGDKRDREGYDVSEYNRQIVELCLVEIEIPGTPPAVTPPLTAAQWERLWPKLTDHQARECMNAVQSLTYEPPASLGSLPLLLAASGASTT